MRDTSIEAYLSVQPTLPLLDSIVFRQIAAAGQDGITCDGVENVLDKRHQSVSSAVNRLMKKELIKDSGKRRVTRSGRKAIVWVVNDEAQMAA